MESSGREMRMRRTAVMLTIAGGLLASCVAGAAAPGAAKDEENPHLWKPRVKSVAVFKDRWASSDAAKFNN